MARRIARTFGIDAYTLFKKFPPNHVFHRLPGHYKKQLIDKYDKVPTPVHYIPDPRKWYKDENTGEKKFVQNLPIPLIMPKEADEGLWGGEGIIKGFKPGRGKRRLFLFPSKRMPHFWVPTLKKSILYSEILDEYMWIVVTQRTLSLIDQAYGFDFYILKTDLVDLRSQLGFKLRRRMLTALIKKDFYHNDPIKQQEIYDKYKHLLIPEEEVEWLGLTLTEAIKKQKNIEKAELSTEYPLKYKYRKELVEKLKVMEAEDIGQEPEEAKSGWLKRFLPFSSAEKSSNKPSTS